MTELDHDGLARILDESLRDPITLALADAARRYLPPDELWHPIEIRAWLRRRGESVLIDAVTVKIPGVEP